MRTMGIGGENISAMIVEGVVRRIVKLLMLLPLLVIVFAGMGWAVFALWNRLMPTIFAAHAITYWQALGLMALSWTLLGAFRGPRSSSSPWGHGMRERWRRMTPAEREEFVKGLRSRWSGTEMPEPEPKA